MSGPRWAYWVKDKSPAQVAASPPARLRAAWPKNPSEQQGCWMAYLHPSGTGSLCVFPRLDGAACNLDAFGPPRDTEDGMVFYPSKETPTAEFLIKPEVMRGPGEWAVLYGGEHLWIGLAFETPRRLIMSLSGARLKEPISEFGKLGHSFVDKFFSKEGIPLSDPDLGRFMFLAIRENYTVTEEMLEDWEILSDRDVNPICLVAFGASPKPSTAEHAPSLSAVRTTKTPT